MQARLTIEPGDGQKTVHDIPGDKTTTLGRSRDNTIVLRDEHSSRLHVKITFEGNRWLLRDFGLNGTRVDGERVQGQCELDHGQEIRIGDTRMRFEVVGVTPNSSGSFRATRPERSPFELAAASTAHLNSDGLALLSQFITSSGDQTDAQELVRQGLSLVLVHTGATLVGFLSLDPSDPIPKLVLPEEQPLNLSLSRHLTRRVQRENKTVWLGTDATDLRPSDSLLNFHDAVCVPLLADGEAFGALHAYKINAFFADRDVRFAEVLGGFLSRLLQLRRVRRTLEAENGRLRQALPSADDLVGDSPALQALRRQIAEAARSSTSVLLSGEPGTGKELAAVSIHRQCPRAAGPLVVVNCAAIPPAQLEADLFGYAPGAFPGAERDSPGLVEQADEGTLFLDEVSELPPACQTRLLDLLEGRGVRPIGAAADRPVDARVIAATTRDLEAEVRAGRFHDGLLAMLRDTAIAVPPLREHREDVPYLVQFFLDRLAVDCRRQVKVTPAALEMLGAADWPGNVRQLRAVLESAVMTASGDTLDLGAFRLESSASDGRPPSLRLADLEAWAIRQALHRGHDDLEQAAQLLGISVGQLQEKTGAV